MQWLYLNGSLVKGEEAALPALDHAFFHGRALIETFCAHGGHVFRLAQHYERLCSGGPVLGITVPLTLDDLAAAVADVLERNDVRDARLRLTLSAGPDAGMLREPQHERKGTARHPGPTALRSAAADQGERANVTLTASPLSDYPPELYERGMHATVADVRRNETSPLSRIKCAAGLLDGVLARERARQAGFDEAIMLNTRGSVAEATVANVFAVKDGRLLTPPIGSGALPGVTRAAVLDLAAEAVTETAERELSLQDLREADEVFLTNAVMGVMPLTRLDGDTIGRGGEVTATLGRRYEDACRSG